LGCTRRDVVAARTRAFQQIRSAMEVHRQQMPSASEEELVLRERPGSALQLLVTPRLATSS
jgi:hypothetical protein